MAVSNPDSDPAISYARHSSGLRYWQRPQLLASEPAQATAAHTAVIAVKTPSFDHSGLAHACEHLVFRSSCGYPSPNTLFQLTQLLDVRINASTCANVTLFHVESDTAEHFLLALDYLFAGMWQPHIQERDISREIGSEAQQSGVLFNELAGFERLADSSAYRLWANIIRCDHSPARINHYGGFSDTIGALKLQHIRDYFNCFYRPHNTHLLSSSSVPIREILKRVSKRDQHLPEPLQKSPTAEFCSPSGPLSNLPSDPPAVAQSQAGGDTIFTWWLPAQCFTTTQQLLTGLAKSLPNHPFQPLLPRLNQHRQFPLRLRVAADSAADSDNHWASSMALGSLLAAANAALSASKQQSVPHHSPLAASTATAIYLSPDFLDDGKYSPAVKTLIIEYFRADFADQEHCLHTREQQLQQIISCLASQPTRCSLTPLALVTVAPPQPPSPPAIRISHGSGDLFAPVVPEQIVAPIRAQQFKPQSQPVFTLPKMLLPLYQQLKQALAQPLPATEYQGLKSTAGDSTTAHQGEPVGDHWLLIESAHHWLAARRHPTVADRRDRANTLASGYALARDIACSDDLLAQRTQGHCYAINCQYDPQQNLLLAYGVFGRLCSNRLKISKPLGNN